MKSMPVTIFTILALAALPRGAAPQGQPDKALLDAAAARMQAMGAGDADGWGRYTTDDFVVIETDGTMKTKTQRMGEIKSTPAPSRLAGATEQKWRMYGPSTAVLVAEAPVDGKPTRITSVWVNQQGQWKVASVQLTTIASAK